MYRTKADIIGVVINQTEEDFIKTEEDIHKTVVVISQIEEATIRVEATFIRIEEDSTRIGEQTTFMLMIDWTRSKEGVMRTNHSMVR